VLSNFREMLRGTEGGSLDLADAAAMNVLNSTAVEADQMVMLGEDGELVMGVIVLKINLADNTCLFKFLQRSINRDFIGLGFEFFQNLLHIYGRSGFLEN